MSERSNVSISEILGVNYYIDKLTSSDYSPSVGDTVTITLLVKDVFGDPATGQSRTVTCTGGQFVSMNGTSITASDSVDVTTGSGGTVTLGLSVSVADNIVVSDGRVECVVSSLSDSITNTYHWNYQSSQGSGQVTYNNDGVVVNAYRRGNTVTVRVRADIKYINMGSDTASLSLATLPTGYRPPIQLYSLNAIYPYYTMFRYGSVNTNGQINLNVKGATSVQTVNAWIDFTFTYVTTEDAPSQ